MLHDTAAELGDFAGPCTGADFYGMFHNKAQITDMCLDAVLLETRLPSAGSLVLEKKPKDNTRGKLLEWREVQTSEQHCFRTPLGERCRKGERGDGMGNATICDWGPAR